MWRTRISNWPCSRLSLWSSACTARERTACLDGAKRPHRSRMMDRHDVDQFASNALRILLLDELREDAFEIPKLQRTFQLGGRSVGQNPPSCDDDDAIADELNDLKNVRDVEDRLALCGERLKKILEQPCRDNVQAGERFVKDEQLRIMKQ